MDVQSKVAAAILTNPKIGQALLEVLEQDGCVTLKGTALSAKDRSLAEDIAIGLDGVRHVVNEIYCE